MKSYLLKRLILAFWTLLVILFVSYGLLRLAPGSPAKSAFFGGEAPGSAVSAEKGDLKINKQLEAELNLDKPIAVGFYLWLKGIVTAGDFGRSAAVDPGRPVLLMIGERLPVTLMLNAIAVFLVYATAIPIGIYSGVHPGGYFDRFSGFVLFFLYSLPVMWVALVLQVLFCQGGIMPYFPLRSIFSINPDHTSWMLVWDYCKSLFLPVVCLSYAGLAGLSRFARSGMREVLGCEYIRTARAKGVPEHRVVYVHALRNALITLITLFSGLLPGLVAGSIIVEYVFGIQGMGALSMLALSSRDYPLQMALFAFSGILTLSGVLLSDLLYMAADPRITLYGRN
ncbi:MAG: ABC transporter permease [Lentisphaeria bacterium]|nr:ABC transporter permease [Lentisphaeria bacterium]